MTDNRIDNGKTYQCRYCDWIGDLEGALDHFEATDHDCDPQPALKATA